MPVTIPLPPAAKGFLPYLLLQQAELLRRQVAGFSGLER
ncbi:hypothetical protein HMPREF9413_4292 [Paenibacillus sp. HGF7]|nr:hypothetical protein HMPREF9413_4292 [Paenibacillus sp. HGF7]